MNNSSHCRLPTARDVLRAAGLLATLIAAGCGAPVAPEPAARSEGGDVQCHPTGEIDVIAGRTVSVIDSGDDLTNWGLWLRTQGVDKDVVFVHRVEFADGLPAVWAFEIALPFEPHVAVLVFNEHRTSFIGTTGKWSAPAMMLAEGGKVLMIWETSSDTMWELTFVAIDGDKVTALDCIGGEDYQTRNRPLIEAAGRTVQILGLKDHRPLNADLLTFAADMNITLSVHP